MTLLFQYQVANRNYTLIIVVQFNLLIILKFTI